MKVEQAQDSKKEDEECFDLAMKGQLAKGHIEGIEMPSQHLPLPAIPESCFSTTQVHLPSLKM